MLKHKLFFFLNSELNLLQISIHSFINMSNIQNQAANGCYKRVFSKSSVIFYMAMM